MVEKYTFDDADRMVRVNRGKKARKSGKDFENKVRDDLESKGVIVARWTNNVELHNENSEKIVGIVNEDNFIYGKLISAKPKFNPFTKSLMMNSGGFPDFIAYRLIKKENDWWYICPQCHKRVDTLNIICEHCIGTQPIKQGILYPIWEIKGVECKSNGYLSKEEKEKIVWLINNNIFSKVLIAKKGKQKGEIVYNEFQNN